MKKMLWLTLLAVTFVLSCGGSMAKIAHDPYYSSFFEKARLIMTKEEVEIYRHLPDATAKEDFIEEFWSKRDPYPETEENENKIEFERRIAYANRYFKENRAMGRGWDTPRGRVLLQLGEPDRRELNDMLQPPLPKSIERWYYYEYSLYLEFIDEGGYGEFKLSMEYNNAQLLTVIDEVNFTMDLLHRENLRKAFRFTASYDDNQVVLTMPVKRMRFEEKAGQMTDTLNITYYLYRDYQKLTMQKITKEISEEKEALLKKSNVQLAIPLSLTDKGHYLIDIIVEEMSANQKYRRYLSFKE